jgi:hypothetical protein
MSEKRLNLYKLLIERPDGYDIFLHSVAVLRGNVAIISGSDSPCHSLNFAVPLGCRSELEGVVNEFCLGCAGY